MSEKILILDFGSQYTQLIARRVRECHVYSEIIPGDTPITSINTHQPKGIILSGSPDSVLLQGARQMAPELLSSGIPVLGICYGMQLIAYHMGGVVERAGAREYGKVELRIVTESPLFKGLTSPLTVWMSHGDRVVTSPPGFLITAVTDSSPVAAFENREKGLYGLQFHPEVAHTSMGREIIKNFLHAICHCGESWTAKSFIAQAVEDICRQVKTGKVICALSGGIDSSVTALLVHKAIGERLVSVFVNNGLLRYREPERVIENFRKKLHMNLRYIDASRRFYTRLAGVVNPEEKRSIIGEEFIRVFEEEAARIGGVKFLTQGTLYPDVVESGSSQGSSAIIKTHHNVGGLPSTMKLKLIEPLKELFKDEVRELAREMGLAPFFIRRQPFPGPGLAVRIVGEITPFRVQTLQQADRIIEEIVEEFGWQDRLWQAFPVLLPLHTVGVMGDERTYHNVVALRAVTSQDGMTADWARLPHQMLEVISSRLVNEIEGVNRVVYDISSKPPSTIEWE